MTHICTWHLLLMSTNSTSVTQSTVQKRGHSVSRWALTCLFFVSSGLQARRRSHSFSLCQDRQRTSRPWVEGTWHSNREQSCMLRSQSTLLTCVFSLWFFSCPSKNELKTDCPYMCAYKLVTVKFRWWGLQTKVESFIHRVTFIILSHHMLAQVLIQLIHSSQ